MTAFAKNYKTKTKRYAIVSAIIAVIIRGLSQMGKLVVTGELLEISKNPFKILYYGMIYKVGIFQTILVAAVLFGIFMYLHMVLFLKDENIDEERNFIISESGVYGTSHQMNEEEKATALRMQKVNDATENIIGLDIETDLAIELNPHMPLGKELNKHKFVSGGSGQRKTRSVVIPDVMQSMKRGESILATDPKGELYKDTYELAGKLGYSRKVFNLFDTINSDGCDFLKMVGSSTIMAQTFAEILMANSVEETGKPKGDFWEKGEKALIAFGILYISLNKEIRPEDKKLYKVYEFLINHPIEEIQAFAESLPENHPARKQWNIFMTTPEQTKGGILTGLATRLQLLNEPTIQNITSHDEIDILEPCKTKCIYYIIMSDQETTLNYIAALFFSFAFIQQVRFADHRYTGKTKIPVNYIFDELPNIGKIPNLVAKMNTLRSRDINCTLITQGLGRLMDKYPGHEWEDLIAACDTQIFLGINEHETNASWWSDKTGTMTVEVESEREHKYLLDPFRMATQSDETKGKGKRNVYTVDELTTMDKDYALVFITGYHVLKVKKFDWSMHEYASMMEQSLAFMHQPEWWNKVKNEEWFKEQYAIMQQEWVQIEQEYLELEEEKESRPKQKKEKPEKTEEILSINAVYQKLKEKISDKIKTYIPKVKLPGKKDILKKGIKTLSQFLTEDVNEEIIQASMQTEENISGNTTVEPNESAATEEEKTKPEYEKETEYVEEYDDLDDFWNDAENAYMEKHEEKQEEMEFESEQEDDYPEEMEMDVDIKEEFINNTEPEPQKLSDTMRRQSNMKNL